LFAGDGKGRWGVEGIEKKEIKAMRLFSKKK
jgi:hypothetical protein